MRINAAKNDAKHKGNCIANSFTVFQKLKNAGAVK
jgi:hypothetical protein